MEQELTGYPSIDKPWLKYYDPDFLKKPIPTMNIYTYLKTMTKDYGASRCSVLHYLTGV